MDWYLDGCFCMGLSVGHLGANFRWPAAAAEEEARRGRRRRKRKMNKRNHLG